LAINGVKIIWFEIKPLILHADLWPLNQRVQGSGRARATLFAATYPQRCRGLVLYGGFARSPFGAEQLHAFFAYADQDWGAASVFHFGRRPVRTILPCNDGGGASSDWARAPLPPWRWCGWPPLFFVHERIGDAIEEFLTGSISVAESRRVLATVLFTDIVGSTAGAEQLGDQRWRDLLVAHHTAVRQEIARYRGSEIKSLGDGFLATFDGPARAVRCACAIAEAVRPLDIQVRNGLHTGEIEIADDDVQGIAVHIAARVSALAGPGEVLVSRTVKDLVAGSGLRFSERGKHSLKGLQEPIELFVAAN
jgi:class 3 adenylate cyclase